MEEFDFAFDIDTYTYFRSKDIIFLRKQVQYSHFNNDQITELSNRIWVKNKLYPLIIIKTTMSQPYWDIVTSTNPKNLKKFLHSNVISAENKLLNKTI